jgi:hypothetical protein
MQCSVEDPNQVSFKENSMRLVVGVLLTAFLIRYFFLPIFPSFLITVILISLTALYNGVPILFIITHDNLKTHSIKKIKSVFTLPGPIIELNV